MSIWIKENQVCVYRTFHKKKIMCKGFYHEQMREKNGKYTSAGKVTSSDIISRSAGNSPL
jgi:hypothetical protein